MRASLIAINQIQLLSMTTSKDSQFLEVCKKPILTPLRSLIKTESRLGPFEPFLRFASYTRGTL